LPSLDGNSVERPRAREVVVGEAKVAVGIFSLENSLHPIDGFPAANL
jgi:hypothetical protein